MRRWFCCTQFHASYREHEHEHEHEHEFPSSPNEKEVTMPGSGGETVLDNLPEGIVVEEILIRLPPKDLLRCRAVRKCWHSATSTDKFMLEHHHRQPCLPILVHAVNQRQRRLFVSRDAGAGQQRLCPILRIYGYGKLKDALDGLLIVSRGAESFICNPVTRKCLPLGKPHNHQRFSQSIAGFYRHQPTREYRVLWVSKPAIYDAYSTNYRTFYYAVVVGSNNTRCIRQGYIPQPTALSPSLELALRAGLGDSSYYPPVHHHGSLPWKLGTYHCCDGSYIMVFNTATETFRLMCQPSQLCPRDLLFLEMDDALALCSVNSDKDTIDVWVMQDYDAETWSFKYRINLSVVDLSPPVDSNVGMCPRMAVLNESELLIQFTCRHILHYDIDGKFLGYLKNEEYKEISLWITKRYLQESVIPLPLFHETREDGAIQEPPFFVGL